MADATMERPDGAETPRYFDLVDQLGRDGTRSVIREALEYAGAGSTDPVWSQRREETIALIERIEAAVDRDLASLAG